LSRPFTSRALCALLAVLMVLPPPTLAQVRLPALGETASDDLSVSNERRIGEQIMREIRPDPDYLDDPVLQDYLLSLWSPLVAAARQRGDIEPDTDRQFAWEAFLVRDRTVNAFALPGGYVGVHLGLISLTHTRDQLASVLAHELTHVTQRHIARSVAPQGRASLLAIAGLLLGVLAASRSNNADAANAAIYGGQAAAIQGQLNFSRDMEREADRVGFGVMGSAGFATAGMAAMFEKMDAATRIGDNGSYPYLRSHPLTVDRMSEARNRTLLAGSAPAAPPLEHALMQARARVLTDNNLQALQRQLGGTSSTALRDRVGAAYAAALAAARLGDHPRAEAQLSEAMQLVASAKPREPAAERWLQLLQAETRLARGDAPGALKALDGVTPEGAMRSVLLMRAQTALDLQRQNAAQAAAELRHSTEALHTWVADHPHDATAWQLLAGTAEGIGQRLRSLRANAEARAALGDLSGAIDRMRAGQGAARAASVGQDFIEASVIDSRLRELVARRRALAIEARGGRVPPGDNPEEPPPR
jgi:beta-barrel assembly-enhancing protease